MALRRDPMRFVVAIFSVFLLAFAAADARPGANVGAPITYNYNTMFATPWMGWSPYEEMGGNGTQAYIEANSDALVSSGLTTAGYKVVKVDEWSNGVRDANGHLEPNTPNFTDMAALASYIKANGQVPMMYTDAGQSGGCAWPGGSGNHFVEDFRYFFLTLGYQGVMVDGCGSYAENLDTRDIAFNLLSAMNQVGVPAFLETAQALYAPHNGSYEWGPLTSNSWWSTGDLYGTGCLSGQSTYASFLSIFWQGSAHPGTTGPYHFSHASLLLTNTPNFTTAEQQAQFAFMTMLSAPIEIGCDVRNFSAGQLAMLKNSDAIAVDQDPWVLGPIRMNYPYTNSTSVYGKWVSTAGERIVILSNEDTVTAHDITITFADIGLTGTVSVFDILNQVSLGTATTSYTATAVPANSVVYLRLTGGTESNYSCYAYGSGQSGTTTGTNCTWEPDPNGNYNAGGYADGSVSSVAHAIDTTGITNPAPQVIYQSARIVSPFPLGAGGAPGKQCSMTDNFWNLVPGATYKIRLHFSENWDTGAGQRKFNVNLYNGVDNTRVLTDYDIFATAGAQFKANVQEFLETAPHGNIAVILSAGAVGCPILNGAEAIKQ